MMNQSGNLQDTRMKVHVYMELLKRKKKLYLLTPLSRLRTLKAKLQKELDKREGVVAKAEEDIARCRRYLSIPRSKQHDLQTNKRKKIRQLEIRISLEKKKIEALQAELERLKTAL